MEHVTGIGGIFFKAKDPKGLLAWYKENLGIDCTDFGAIFRWQDDPRAASAVTVWCPFAEDTDYFAPSHASFMINFRVRNLDAMREQLKRAGAAVDEKVQTEENGRFGWALDPEGNRFELWEPAEGC
jgi:predicted enzyme related to lactoylglutathione lyase